MQPGDTIKPENASNDDVTEVTISHEAVAGTDKLPEPTVSNVAQPSETPTQPIPEHDERAPAAQQETSPAAPEQQASLSENESNSQWKYSSVESNAGHNAATEIGPVTWTASEFVDHEKDFSWFLKLGGITVVLVAIIYLVTEEAITSIVIILASALFGVTASRKPRTLEYQITPAGVSIGGKLYKFEIFKSFSVIEEEAFNSIQLMPLKRFMTPISLYFPPEQEEQIITTLGSYLPHEERGRDPVDRLMRKVRF